MNSNKTYHVLNESKTLKRFADVYDTIDAIKRIVAENHKAVEELADYLQGRNDQESFQKIWDYVRHTVRYQKDDKGVEQLRTPQRTLHDKTGDCDDMSILISSILTNLKIQHSLVVAAYKKENQWQHIYPVAYDHQGNRFVLDCVPEIPYFNYEALPIKNKIVINMPSQMGLLKENNMKLEELGDVAESAVIEELTEPFNLEGLGEADTEDEEFMEIQGLLGNVVIVDEDEEYDTVLSGSELQRNIILQQLIEAKKALQKEYNEPGAITQYSEPQKEINSR